jgi:aconitate hydratase
MFHTEDSPEAEYSDTLELDLGGVEPSLAGPRRPQDRIRLSDVKPSFFRALDEMRPAASRAGAEDAGVTQWEKEGGAGRRRLRCTAGEVHAGRRGVRAAGRRRRHRGDHELHEHVEPVGDDRCGTRGEEGRGAGPAAKPWVKTSLAPGSKVVTDYLDDAGLTPYLDELGFSLVGYGCTTCIGNSGPLPEPISRHP